MARTLLLVSAGEGEDDDVTAGLISSIACKGFNIVLASASPPTHHQDSKFVGLDLSGGEPAIERCVSEAWDAFGRIDVLVLCCWSDPSHFKPALEVSEKEWDEAASKNLKAAWLVSKSVARRMRDAGSGGSIVFVTSIAATDRGLFPGTSVYGTNVAGIHHLSKALALELGKFKIRVNCIVRGWSESDAAAMISSSSSVSRKLSSGNVSKLLPLQRWADPARDFASSLLFFAGFDSSFVTGTTVAVDGGQSLVRPRLKSRF